MLHIPDEDVSNAVALADLTPEQRRVMVTLGALGVPPVREGAGSGLYGDLRAEVPRPRVSGPGEREGSYVTNERRGDE